MKKAKHLSAAEREEDRKKKRRAVRVILSVIIILMIAGVIFEVSVLKGMTSVDRRFIRGVERGVTDGWSSGSSDLQLKEQGRVTDTAFIEKELEAVGELRNKPFHDRELRKLARQYIDDLKKCRAAAAAYDPDGDNEAFWEEFAGPYADRLVLLRKFRTGDYKMGSSWDEYPEQRDEVLLRGWAIEKAEDLRFEKAESGEGVYKYTAKLKNDSGVDISYLNIDVKLYDSSDKAVGTAEVIKENIKDGSEASLVFYSGSEISSYRAASVDCLSETKEEE